MNKPMLGLVLGGLLGIVDGLTAWFTPAVRPMLGIIVVSSTIKGLLAGVLIGLVARKVPAIGPMVGIGLVISLLLAWGVAAMPDESGNHYYVQIMLPGAILGMIVGFATARYGKTSSRSAVRA